MNRERLLHFLRPRSFSRFVLIGGINTVNGLSMFPLLYWLARGMLGVNVLLIISYILCTLTAFLLHRFVTFQSRGSYRGEALRYAAFSTVLYAINAAALNGLLHYTHLPPVPVQVCISLTLSSALMLANYFGLSRFVFASSNRPEAS